jgi:error-prone DNA polymerase
LKSRAIRRAGPLLEEIESGAPPSPLARMDDFERLDADYRGTGVTIGRHPLAWRREELRARGVSRASDLARMRNGRPVRVAGCVIVRQRPGTAHGFVFLSLEDETGISNIIVTPGVFEANRGVLVNAPLLLVEGALQKQDGAVSVKAARLEPLPPLAAAIPSHDFH